MSDVLVLCYHAVSERWRSPLAVSPKQLRSQLAFLVRRGYRGARFEEALAGPAPKTLAVTFDDAYRSVLEMAAPILASLGLQGSVFVPTAFPDRDGPMSWPGIDQWVGGPHEHELVPLSWAELRGLAGAGWEVGSHTRSHPRLTSLGDRELDEELAGSRADCEARLGVPCRSLAYPYGDADARVAAAARRAGYSAAGRLERSLRPSTALGWPRTGIYPSDDGWRYRAKISPSVRLIRASTLFAAADRRRGRPRS